MGTESENLLPDAILDAVRASNGHDPGSRRHQFDAGRLRWVVDEAIKTVCLAYEGGDIPKSTSETVQTFLEPDLGVLNSLNLVKNLLDLAFQFKTVPNLAIFEAISNAFGLEFTTPEVELSQK